MQFVQYVKYFNISLRERSSCVAGPNARLARSCRAAPMTWAAAARYVLAPLLRIENSTLPPAARSASACRLLVRLEEALNVFDLLLGADEQGHALVDLLGGDLHHTLGASGAHASSLLHDEAHGSALVQQPKLAVGVLGVAGVSVQASVQHGAVEVAHKGADVAGRVGLASPQVRVLQAVHVLLQAGVPQVVVALVEGVNLAGLRHLDVAVREHELADGRVEGETVYALADGENEDDGGGVHAVPGTQEAGPGLAGADDALVHDSLWVVHILDGARIIGIVDPEDGAGGDGSIDIGGAVEGVEDHDVVAGVGLLHGHGGVLLLGGNDSGAAGALQAGAENVVGDHVQLLLVLALHVDLASQAGHVGEAGTLHQAGNLLAGQSDGGQHNGQLGVNVALGLLL
mmetsp:Transcript_4906/g.13697  ORF Transcript_4906/g.13697 Transcript_4906/m.13697 type:complete len:401 (+) Transcript_4906:60-1262(+)